MDPSPCRKGHRYKYAINNFDRFDTDDNKLDLDVKASILKTAENVVCLKSYSGDKDLFICCGIIMECESRLGTSIATIFTSASLLRLPNGEPELASDLKLVDNVVEVAVGVSHRTDDRDLVNTLNRFRLYRGVKVLALARYFQEPGCIRSGRRMFGFDCKELLKASCKIKKNGIGGPLINLHGEVIGINFYEPSYTPFLPMNIVIKCFEDLKNAGLISRPSLGVVVSDLYTTSFHNLENLRNKFPNVVKGAIIDEVLPDSAAHKAGLCPHDVIINCGGASIGGFLELTEILWGKEGKPIEVVVVRASVGEQLRVFVNAVGANPRENRWPVPKLQMMSNHPLHNARPFW